MSDAAGQALTDRLTPAERQRLWPNVRPKDAASLIVIDRSGRRPKVLMGRRHDGHRFMPGKFVFPGGRIEPIDRYMPVAGALHPRAEAALHMRVSRPTHHLGRTLALAAIRETYEETGFLLGTKEHGAPAKTPSGPWAVFQERAVFPDLEALQLVARAITPPRRLKRFDTRFFAADRRAVAEEIEGMVGPDTEFTELAWVSFAEADQLDMPTITRVILEELEQRIAQGFGHELPVPFYYERRERFVRELL